jgi:predicted nucleic acid-binding protein
MKEYVLDANAVLFYLDAKESENASTVDRLIDMTERRQASLFMTAVNLGEVFYILRKMHPEGVALRMVGKITGLAAVTEVDTSTAIRAAELKYRYKLGYADSFAALLAMERKATLVSSDPDFERLGRSIKWLRLAHHAHKS